MDTVICKELIVSTIARRGKGIPGSPVRCITQVFEKDGTLLAEHDPCPEMITYDQAIDFVKECSKFGLKDPTPSDLLNYISNSRKK